MSEPKTSDLVVFKTPYGVISCRPVLDGKAIQHFKTHTTYMESDLMLMASFIEPKDEIIDVGANLGAFSIPLSKFAQRVHAFEAIPETADHLEYNISQNSITNIVVHRSGLSDRGGVLYSHRVPDSGSTSLTDVQEYSDAPNVEIPVTTIDALYKGTRISFIKIDVEGMEEKVLRGAQEVISESQPVVFFEIQKGNMGAFGVSFNALARFFDGYRFYFNLHIPQDGTYILGRLPWLGLLKFSSGTQNVIAVPRNYSRPIVSKGIIETMSTLTIRKIRNLIKRNTR